MSRTAKGLSEQTEFFERRKLQQLKGLLTDFIMTEATFHAKAVELFTVAYHQVQDINDKADLDNFRRKLRSPEKNLSTGLQARSSSLASLMMNQPSPTRDEGESIVNVRKSRSPEKSNPGMTRSNSLGVLMNQSKDDDDDTTGSNGSEETSSGETESD